MADPTIRELQRTIEATFLERDRRRGIGGTFLWFVEEVGELARALKKGEPENLREEFADVLAWLSTLASLSGVDLSAAAAPYLRGCPTCGGIPCACPMRGTLPEAGSGGRPGGAAEEASGGLPSHA